MTVIAAADAVETEKAVFAAVEYEGPVYLRTVRCPVPVIFDEDYDFRIGKACMLKQGKDIALIGTGMMTAKALKAGEILDGKGISARVIHMPTIKPIDEKTIITASEEIGHIITIENHSIIGGLGGAVAEVLTTHAPCYLKRLGFKDCFGESGDNEAIFSKYGMNTENIVDEALSILKRS